MSHSSLNRTNRARRIRVSRRGGMSLRWSMFFLCTIGLSKIAAKDQDWANVGGDKGHQRYSNLDQINRNNVDTLQVAWSYHTGDAGATTTIECTPIVIGGV